MEVTSAVPHVLILGDLFVDEYVYAVTRPGDDEGGSPIVRVANRERFLGGAGHVAAIVTALGGRPTAVGLVGADDAGDTCRERLVELHPRAADALIKVPGRPTAVKSRVLADDSLILRVDTEEVAPIDPETERALSEAWARLVDTADVCVVSDYGKGCATGGVCRSAIERARSTRVPVVVDPKDPDFARYAGADVVTPNARELFEAAGRDPSLNSDRITGIERAGRQVADSLPGATLVVTLDRDGLLVIEPAGPVTQVPSCATAITDPTGAGDAVTAAIAFAVGSGRSILYGVELASRVAAIVVARRGTAPIDPAAMADLLASTHRR